MQHFYSMEITGVLPSHKAFLQAHLNTITEYSWLVNLDDSENPYGDHYLSVCGSLEEIGSAFTNLFKRLGDNEDLINLPSLRKIDPDEKSKWQNITVRERFSEKKHLPNMFYYEQGRSALLRYVLQFKHHARRASHRESFESSVKQFQKDLVTLRRLFLSPA